MRISMILTAAAISMAAGCMTTTSPETQSDVAMSDATAETQTVNYSRPDPDKVICKKQYKTGSRLPVGNRCMSRRQWDEEARRARRVVEEEIDEMARTFGPH